MVRAPCCEKMGLKKGPWTKEEDHILITYINQHGHQNWRALPKKAGLLRCGKSCRLRWINYLRPDIKRGNFSKEEEDIIIHSHQVLGNRWSAIAAKLPGRTDNEIKNVWHTHFKKRLFKREIPQTQDQQIETMAKFDHGRLSTDKDDSMSLSMLDSSAGSIKCLPNSPSHSSSSTGDVSSSITAATNPENADISHPDLDGEYFSWLDVVSSENSGFNGEDGLCFPLSPLHSYTFNVDFWSDLFTRDEELLQLPEF